MSSPGIAFIRLFSAYATPISRDALEVVPLTERDRMPVTGGAVEAAQRVIDRRGRAYCMRLVP